MYHFIVNPDSGSGRGRKIWKQMEKQLNKNGQEYRVYFTKGPQDAAETAKTITAEKETAKILIVIGGEGTYNEVLNGISFKGMLTLGYVPAGFRNAGLSGRQTLLQNSRNIRRVLQPRYYEMMDYGVLTSGEDEIFSRRFAGRCGVGLDAAICHNQTCSQAGSLMRRFHMLRLHKLILGVKQLTLAEPVKGYMILDYGKRVEFDHLYFVTFRFPGFKTGKQKEKCESGKMRVYVANSSKKLHMFPILIDIITGVRKKERGVRVYECSEAKLHLNRPLAVHVDGASCMCQQDMVIRCIPKQIRMISS